MIEVFDSKGKVKTMKVKDSSGKTVEKVQTQLLRNGDVVALPQDKIEKLAGDVEMVMVPATVPDEEPEDTGTDAKDEADPEDKTVAAQIPKK
jgi:hypothetical protein